jgi:hypothetical protein
MFYGMVYFSRTLRGSGRVSAASAGAGKSVQLLVAASATRGGARMIARARVRSRGAAAGWRWESGRNWRGDGTK